MPSEKFIKHPHHILAVANNVEYPKEVGFYRMNLDDWLTTVESTIFLGRRHELEMDDRYRQVLPYVIIKQRQADGTMFYSTYYRTKLVGEQKLANSISIGYGGHIDLSDMFCRTDSVIDLRQTIVNAVRREIVQEVQILVDGKNISEEIPIIFVDKFIYSSEQRVDKYHVGVIMEIEIPLNATINTGEEELGNMPMMSAKDIQRLHEKNADFDGSPMLESWSRLYIKDVIEEETGLMVNVPFCLRKVGEQYVVESCGPLVVFSIGDTPEAAIAKSNQDVLNAFSTASKMIEAGSCILKTKSIADTYSRESALGYHQYYSEFLLAHAKFSTVRTFDDGASGYVFQKELTSLSVEKMEAGRNVWVEYELTTLQDGKIQAYALAEFPLGGKICTLATTGSTNTEAVEKLRDAFVDAVREVVGSGGKLSITANSCNDDKSFCVNATTLMQHAGVSIVLRTSHNSVDII